MNEIPQPVNVASRKPATPASQDTTGLRIDVQVQKHDYEHDISPATPHSQHHIDDLPISPIDASAPVQARTPLPERVQQSQIPRRIPQPTGETAPIKWDEHSGEPTNDERGKPSSVRPGTQPVEMQYPHLKERTKQILAGIRQREAAKTKQWGRIPPPVAPDPLDHPLQREPWKGASGRTALVDPVKNTNAPRIVPIRKEPAKPESPGPHHAGPARFYAEATGPVEPDVSQRSPDLRTSPSVESLRPVVPLKTRNLTPDKTNFTPIQSPTREVHSTTPTGSPELVHPALRSETPRGRVESPQYDSEPNTPTTPIADQNADHSFLQTPPAYHEAPDFGREQSHFSWTTYTTSADDSPRSLAQAMRDSSPPPSMPGLPPTITIKKRPVSGNAFMQSYPSRRDSLQSSPYIRDSYTDSTGSVNRKPLPGAGAGQSPALSQRSRVMSTSKSLPPTPTVIEAADKIEGLEAQIEALERRKRNTARIINDLEAALKKNAVVYDMWKRKEVEKNITNHKLSLDDIASEIHELSLTLHRAQRKRDRDDGYELNTGLWVKRVTS